VNKLLNEEVTVDERQIELLYPYRDDYRIIDEISQPTLIYKTRDLLETQNIRKLYLTQSGAKLHNPLPRILENMWGDVNLDNHKINRDWITLKRFNPFLKDTLPETLDQFKGDIKEKTTGLLLTLLRMYSLSDKTIKGFIYGPGTWDPKESYFVLNNLNKYQLLTSESYRVPKTELKTTDPDSIFLLYNLMVLSSYAHHDKVMILKMMDVLNITSTDIDNTITDPGISNSIKKRLLILAMYTNSIKSIPEWTKRTGLVLHYWQQRQRRSKIGVYSGYYELLLIHSRCKMIFSGDESYITISCNDTSMVEEMYLCMKEFLSIMNMVENDLINITDRGDWMISNDKIIPTVAKFGFKMQSVPTMLNEIPLGDCSLTVDDEWINIFDKYNEKIYAIGTGLLRTSTNIHIPQDLDFSVFNLPVSAYIDLRFFREDWDSRLIPRSNYLNFVRDLEVDKPSISKITMERLNLKGDDFQITNLDIAEDDELDATIERHDNDHISDKFFSKFMEITPDDLKDVSFEFDVHSLNLDIDIMKLGGFMDTTGSKMNVIKAKTIWNKCKNAKYYMISSLLLDITYINSRSIQTIDSMYRNPRLRWSLIKTYDTFLRDTSTTSPKGIKLDIDSDFDEWITIM
jgi:hypothetical protein